MNKNKFYKHAVNFIIGATNELSVTGTQNQVSVTKECLLTSRALYEALESESSQLPEILVLAENKKTASRKYAKVFRRKWLL